MICMIKNTSDATVDRSGPQQSAPSSCAMLVAEEEEAMLTDEEEAAAAFDRVYVLYSRRWEKYKVKKVFMIVVVA